MPSKKHTRRYARKGGQRAESAKMTGEFWVCSAPLTEAAQGYGFVTNGVIDVYVPPQLVSVMDLNTSDLGERYMVDYITTPGSRFMALYMTHLPRAPQPISAPLEPGDRVLVERALAVLEDALDGVYEALGIQSED